MGEVAKTVSRYGVIRAFEHRSTVLNAIARFAAFVPAGVNACLAPRLLLLDPGSHGQAVLRLETAQSAAAQAGVVLLCFSMDQHAIGEATATDRRLAFVSGELPLLALEALGRCAAGIGIVGLGDATDAALTVALNHCPAFDSASVIGSTLIGRPVERTRSRVQNLFGNAPAFQHLRDAYCPYPGGLLIDLIETTSKREATYRAAFGVACQQAAQPVAMREHPRVSTSQLIQRAIATHIAFHGQLLSNGRAGTPPYLSYQPVSNHPLFH